jgi:trans-aconitate 2-methyltransferase
MPKMLSPAPIETRSLSDWNPSLYMKFMDARTRAARDLLGRVPLGAAALAYDLGCGPGNSSELLLRRFPEADLVGVDTSESMLAHARMRAPKARFVRLNIADWTPDAAPSLIFTNAALQFLPDHHALFPRLAALLAPGGVLAAQMPSNANESSHALMRMIAAEGPWSSRLVPVAKTQPLIASVDDYYEWLQPLCSAIELWMTTYVYQFGSAADVADFFAGSGLHPFLERLSDDERCDFLGRYREGLREAYPAQSDGKVLLPYPRLFIVAVRR